MNIVVDVSNLTRRFGDFVAVDDVSFAIPKGAIFGFLGPNGAGKSTTIRMLLGILQPSQGKGQVLGYDLYQQQELIRARVGYMAQKFSLYEDLTVEENLAFLGGIFGLSEQLLRHRIDANIDLARLQDYRRQLAGSLPGGIRQRLALAASLIHDPELIFLDEPTGAVDPALRRYFWELIADLSEQGKTIMVTSHYMDEVERCHTICFIDRGKLIAQGTPSKLKQDYVSGSLWRLQIGKEELANLSLDRHEGVTSVVPTGGGARVLLAPGYEDLLVSQLLSDTPYKVDPIESTLEDVFVHLATLGDAGGI